MTTILHKRGKGIPTADKFSAVGEILIDSETGIAYTLTDAGDVVPVGGDQVWTVTEPDEFGIRVAKFSDQASDPSDAHDFLIIYYTDAAGSTKSRATISAQYLFGEKVEAKSVKATDFVEAPEVKAQAIEGIATVTGTLVVGDPAERKGEEEVRAPNGTAIAVGPTVGGFPPGLRWGATVSMDGTIQAKDYLDKDGNSIVSDVSNLMSANSLNQCYEEDWGIIGEGFELRTDGIITNRFWKHIFQDQYVVASSADPDSPVFRLTAFEGGSAYFNGAVQATDFLDADGNSIVGGGMDIPTEYKYQDKVVVGTIRDDAPNRGNNHTVLGDDVGVDRGNAVAIGWRASSWGDSTAVGVEAGASMGATAIGNNAIAFNLNGIALGYTAQTTKDNQFVISPNITEVDFSNATIQAADFLDADGNSIVNKQQVLTQSEYDGLTPDPDTVYFII